MFGVTAKVCALVWKRSEGYIPVNGSTVHPLWALLFLKTYASEHNIRAIVKVNEQTFRKWCWTFINILLADLNVVRSFSEFYQVISLASSKMPF